LFKKTIIKQSFILYCTFFWSHSFYKCHNNIFSPTRRICLYYFAVYVFRLASISMHLGASCRSGRWRHGIRFMPGKRKYYSCDFTWKTPRPATITARMQIRLRSGTRLQE